MPLLLHKGRGGARARSSGWALGGLRGPSSGHLRLSGPLLCPSSISPAQQAFPGMNIHFHSKLLSGEEGGVTLQSPAWVSSCPNSSMFSGKEVCSLASAPWAVGCEFRAGF